METKAVILKPQTERGLSQPALAEKPFVARQAVSRWGGSRANGKKKRARGGSKIPRGPVRIIRPL